MSDAPSLNQTIQAGHPAAAATLSALGRRIFFPRGIPAQAADARDCAVNATIGQLTDGAGGAVPLPSMMAPISALPAESVVLYSSQGGDRALREAWRERIVARAPTRAGLPVVTSGLTHGLSILADLFIEEDREVLLPAPSWGNYRLIFGVRAQGLLRPYPVISGNGFDVAGLKRTLARCQGPAVVVLNVPSNPVGYTPTLAEADALVEVFAESPVPVVVICDDAYHGMVWEDGLLPHSLFHRLSQLPADRVLAVKVDGATKELFFFGGRVGFVTIGAEGPVADALENKLIGLCRSSISTVSTSGQALVLNALRNPATQAEADAVLAQMRHRYTLLRDGFAAAGLHTYPFNSAFFALVRTKRHPEEVRQALLADGVGVVAVPSAGAVRVGYASVADKDIPTLVAALARHAV